MDTLKEIFQSLLQLILCISPFVIIAFVVAGFAFYKYHNNQRRKELFTKALEGVSTLKITEIDTLISSGAVPNVPISTDLLNGAHLLLSLKEGKIDTLEQKELEKFIQVLSNYRQRSAYGKLPTDEQNHLRQKALQSVDILRTTISRVTQAAEDGDAEAFKSHLLESSRLLYSAHEDQVHLIQQLEADGVSFPVSPPPQAHITPTSASTAYMRNPEQLPMQIAQQLPDDKQALFMMQYNGVKKNPTTAVLFAVLLGGVGAHKFYMGRAGLGILYILFSWTWIPAIIGLFEAFTISRKVHNYNNQKAYEIAAILRPPESNS